ncbi:MAG: DUF3575 domain-containing protein [Lepagella sp.]
MKRLCRNICLAFSLIFALSVCAEEHDSVSIFFHQSKINLDSNFKGNRRFLDEFKQSHLRRDSIYHLNRAEVVGAASPEGSIAFNRWLSEQRANTLFTYIRRYEDLPDSLLTFTFKGRDWEGLLARVEIDTKVPYQQEVVALVKDIVATGGECVNGRDPLLRLKKLRGGEPYRYLYKNIFPDLRYSYLHLWYDRRLNPNLLPYTDYRSSLYMPAVEPVAPDFIPVPASRVLKPFYMAVRTNMLYDALIVPNVGLEFYLGGHISIGANWMYSWWKSDRTHWYWRTYGGDLNLRYYFANKEPGYTPFKGHHVGVYGQVLTYDIDLGGKGYIGGRPGGSMWDKCHWGVGVEYGYSLPIHRRLNLDFTLGLGYLTGEFWEYKPIDQCYVWQATKRLHWWGPTKLEVSLVWLIGRGNVTKKGGGR